MTDREKLIEIRKSVSCKKGGCRFCDYSKYEHCMEELLVDHLIANGVVVREKGEWEPILNSRGEHAEVELCASWWRCKKCGHEDFLANFCPNCGADMRKGENG